MSQTAAPTFITPEALLAHWQGHRRVTRRVIEKFPDDQFLTFAIDGMRSFGLLVKEFFIMEVPMVRGVVTGTWEMRKVDVASKADALRLWDEDTKELDALWPQIAPERFLERMTAFGQYEGPLYDLLLYVIDNEIHHRGQGYVYLRALGVEPPFFFDRS